MKIVDARKLPCPQPLLLLKKALEEGEKELEVIVDREDALQNVLRFSSSKGAFTTWSKEGEDYHIKIESKGEVCEVVLEEEMVKIFISSDRIGKGNDDLGLLLMKSFLNTLPEGRVLPAKILLMNTGILLACNEDTSLSLKKLEEKGVEVLVCGTCLKFFDKEKELKVGKVSNMFEISENLLVGSVLTL